MMQKEFDYIIAGAGIVGLTTAFELCRREPSSKILILEKEPRPGLHASGRNSGVLHSGIYYSSDTLKARICAQGARKMREFAAINGIPFTSCGKVIIATCPDDLPAIDRLMKNAEDNRIRAEKLDEAGIRKIEPYAHPYKNGIFTPDTAVIDSRAVLQKLLEILTHKGVIFQFNEEIVRIDPERKQVYTRAHHFGFGYFVNTAGAHADKLAAWFGLGKEYAFLPFKGLYFKIRPDRSPLVKANIYPVPDLNMPFLGIHLTRVMSGDVYAGPTAIPALGRENYGLFEGIDWGECPGILSRLLEMYVSNQQSFRSLVHREIQNYWKPYFVEAVRKLVSELEPEDLIPSDKAGIRPQLVRRKDKKLQMDFVLEQTAESFHVLNAISPAFTSSFAFAELIADRIQTKTFTTQGEHS